MPKACTGGSKSEATHAPFGDMPHSWAAAEYVLYLRDALLREENNRLVLADGIPGAWLRPGQRVEIHSAPTYFGRAGYSLVSHADEGYWELMIDEGTKAPDGFLLRGPFPSGPTGVVIDGQETPFSEAGEIALPSGARIVRIYF